MSTVSKLTNMVFLNKNIFFLQVTGHYISIFVYSAIDSIFG